MGAKPSLQRDMAVQTVAGAGAGAFTQTVVAPMDRVKIILQIQGMHGQSEKKYSSIARTFRLVVQEEGFRALYNGNGANCTRVVPVYALKFMFNDTYKHFVRSLSGSAPNDPLSFGQLVGAGAMAGLTTSTLTYPLETIRTRLSLAQNMKQGSSYKGVIGCAKFTYQKEGLSAFYKGLMVTWMSNAPYVGLQMSLFDVFKRNLPTSENGSSSVVNTLVAGAAAGVIAQTTAYPGDTLRRRMQTNGIGGSPRIYINTWDAFKQIVRKEGPGGLYKGVGANTMRAIPSAAIQFATYGFLKDNINAQLNQEQGDEQ